MPEEASNVVTNTQLSPAGPAGAGERVGTHKIAQNVTRLHWQWQLGDSVVALW